MGARVEFFGHDPDPPPPPHTHTPQPEIFSIFDEEPGGTRPDRSSNLSATKERVLRCTVQQIVDTVPSLPTLDAPVPQTVEQLPNRMQFFDTISPDPEQVIEVPKILSDDVPMRTPVREPQLAEQLVEVPTIVSFSSSSWSWRANIWSSRFFPYTELVQRCCLLWNVCVQQTSETPQLQSIDMVYDVPLLQVLEKLVEIPQLHSSYSCLDKVVHTPVVCNDRCPDGSDARKLCRFRSCSTFERGRCTCYAGAQRCRRYSSCGYERPCDHAEALFS